MVKFAPIKEACKEVGVSEYYLRNLVKKGECPGFYSGSRFRVNVGKLEEKLREETSAK